MPSSEPPAVQPAIHQSLDFGLERVGSVLLKLGVRSKQPTVREIDAAYGFRNSDLQRVSIEGTDITQLAQRKMASVDLNCACRMRTVIHAVRDDDVAEEMNRQGCRRPIPFGQHHAELVRESSPNEPLALQELVI